MAKTELLKSTLPKSLPEPRELSYNWAYQYKYNGKDRKLIVKGGVARLARTGKKDAKWAELLGSFGAKDGTYDVVLIDQKGRLRMAVYDVDLKGLTWQERFIRLTRMVKTRNLNTFVAHTKKFRFGTEEEIKEAVQEAKELGHKGITLCELHKE